MTATTVRIGTRASALARTQTGHVADALTSAAAAAGVDVRVKTVPVTTEGDRSRASLAQLGGTGVFVTALRDALLADVCDLAVHSLKDLPTAPAPGLEIVATPERVSPLDALCARDGLDLAGLPRGARVGTGSPRRKAQLLAARPDLEVVDIRGNVETRLARALGADADLHAVVLAAAGLARLGRSDVVSEVLAPDVMMPAPGQGVLAVEQRAGASFPGVAALDHIPTRLAATAERTLLARLEAGCAAPVGALGTVSDDGRTLELQAVVASLDGTRVLRHGASSVCSAAWLPGEPRPTDEELTASLVHDVQSAATLGADLADLLLDLGAADIAPLR
ncbi:hydroxymethylbilane synthase [Flavimobilis soli]|uniref:Hydroxymethylbilane synthase n=1 Tax=Flavimobilis soli TaxID=442709 RepID=A0A2A9EEP7_9MICO|nr:hydroxymethylbilane synthase [Flavimobilis soli]PFG37021.1 hydroxymethylbilane synthase [Flavimobilis soli]